MKPLRLTPKNNRLMLNLMPCFKFFRLAKHLLFCFAGFVLVACTPETSEQSPAKVALERKSAEFAEILPSQPLAEIVQAEPETKPVTERTAAEALEIDWLDLMSDADRERLQNGDWIDESASEAHPGQEGSFTSDMAERQIKGFAAISDFDNQRVKLAGYFVPLEQDDSGQITDILFVPYFGACIHVPPPPANQIIYAKLRVPQSDVNMFEAYWLEGVLLAKTNQSELAEAGYTMSDSHLYLWN